MQKPLASQPHSQAPTFYRTLYSWVAAVALLLVGRVVRTSARPDFDVAGLPAGVSCGAQRRPVRPSGSGVAAPRE